VDGSTSHSLPLASRIRSLETFETNYLALLELGAHAWFGSPLQVLGTPMAEDFVNPVGCFLSQNMILVADANQIGLFQRRGDGLSLAASQDGLQSTPIACLAIRDRRQAALFLRDGRVVILETS
jgi:hypothetical protein